MRGGVGAVRVKRVGMGEWVSEWMREKSGAVKATEGILAVVFVVLVDAEGACFGYCLVRGSMESG